MSTSNKPGYMEGGLNRSKYIIAKSNGDEVDSDAQYFVLRLDKDPHALLAALVYSQSVESDNPELADDILQWVDTFDNPKARELRGMLRAGKPARDNHEDESC